MSDRATSLLLVIPAAVLAFGALLRSVPGEWSQSALLAWAAVGLGFLSGQSGSTPALAGLGLTLGFAVLALGGQPGLVALAAVYAALAIAAMLGVVVVPWPVAALLAGACALGAARSLVH